MFEYTWQYCYDDEYCSLIVAYDEKKAEKRDEIARRPLFTPSTSPLSLTSSTAIVRSEISSDTIHSQTKQQRIAETRKKLGMKTGSNVFNNISGKNDVTNSKATSTKLKSKLKEFVKKSSDTKSRKFTAKTAAEKDEGSRNMDFVRQQDTASNEQTPEKSNWSLVCNYDSASSSEEHT